MDEAMRRVEIPLTAAPESSAGEARFVAVLPRAARVRELRLRLAPPQRPAVRVEGTSVEARPDERAGAFVIAGEALPAGREFAIEELAFQDFTQWDVSVAPPGAAQVEAVLVADLPVESAADYLVYVSSQA